MERKNYVAPAAETVELASGNSLLEDSGTSKATIERGKMEGFDDDWK